MTIPTMNRPTQAQRIRTVGALLQVVEGSGMIAVLVNLPRPIRLRWGTTLLVLTSFDVNGGRTTDITCLAMTREGIKLVTITLSAGPDYYLGVLDDMRGGADDQA